MKMKLNIIYHCKLLIALLIIASCSVNNQTDLLSVDVEYLNNQIQLRPAKYLNSYNTKDSITLELKYNSTNRIVFPRNFNLRYFEKRKSEWVEINEKNVERYPLNEVIFSPEDSNSLVHIINAFPEILIPTKKCHLRIYVSGVMDTSEGPVDVAAFTDVYLSP